MTRRANLGYAALLVFALLVPALGIYPVFAMQLLCFAMFACAFNLLLGFSGMLSFGHAAFFGSASYITGWLVTAQGWGPAASLAGGALAAAALGLVIGAIAIRRQGI
ncbi:MAG: branched-chain amino acid ABC transporter permease, partial [Burkholderiales bacterium]|nr:branched-chain amino acid ABC transporter permease [Burkholderiales bacterium]